MTEQQKIDQIESDRRRRERELLAILLLISSRSYRYALQAIRLGHPPDSAISNVFNGNAALDLTGLSPAYAEALIDAHGAGFKRAASFSGETIHIFSPAESTVDAYTALATKWTASMADTLIARVLEAVDAVAGVKAKSKALREAYAAGGHTVDNPYAVVNASTTAIVTAYGNGMFDRYEEGEPILLRHHTIDDGRETRICHDRIGLTLWSNDPYWRSNWPSLHFGCRSFVANAPPNAEVSGWLPAIPPAPGFGVIADALAV